MHTCDIHRGAPATVVHRVECVHQAEVEVWPAVAQAYFRDERYSDPASCQVQFDATVYNTPSRSVRWEVQSIHGGPGAGTINRAGLYTAPDKGTLSGGTTEIVVATAGDDPFRKAFARVTLVGRGPEPLPVPRIEVFPKNVRLYMRSAGKNEYIDESNKRQLFRVEFRDTHATSLRWTVRTGISEQIYVTGYPWFDYVAPSPPGLPAAGTLVVIEVEVPGVTTARDTATVALLNYDWPPLSDWGV